MLAKAFCQGRPGRSVLGSAVVLVEDKRDGMLGLVLFTHALETPISMWQPLTPVELALTISATMTVFQWREEHRCGHQWAWEYDEGDYGDILEGIAAIKLSSWPTPGVRALACW